MKEKKSRLMVQLEQEKKKLQEDIAKLKVCVSKESVLDGFTSRRELDLWETYLNVNMAFNLVVIVSVCLQQMRQQPSLDESTGSTVSGEHTPLFLVTSSDYVEGRSQSVPVII